MTRADFSVRFPGFSGWLRFARMSPVLALLALAACVAADAPPLPVSQAPQVYRIGSGDRIGITVFGQSDMSGEFDVDETGNVALPLVGAVSSKNKTPRELEQGLETYLGRNKLVVSPKVNVAVIRYRPVYILGEVARPGAYPYYPGITTRTAVALAGGYTYRANQKKVEVVRDEFNREPKSASQDAYIEPGDVIIIPERWF